MVYLHCPNVFHSLTVLSRDADTICLLSAEKATLSTSFVCPTNRLVVLPLKEDIEYEATYMDASDCTCTDIQNSTNASTHYTHR